jgi:hypothetical protein
MTAEKILKMTKKEKQVINDLYMMILDAFVDEEASTESFASILYNIAECIYYNQSVTDDGIKIITEEENEK